MIQDEPIVFFYMAHFGAIHLHPCSDAARLLLRKGRKTLDSQDVIKALEDGRRVQVRELNSKRQIIFIDLTLSK